MEQPSPEKRIYRHRGEVVEPEEEFVRPEVMEEIEQEKALAELTDKVRRALRKKVAPQEIEAAFTDALALESEETYAGNPKIRPIFEDLAALIKQNVPINLLSQRLYEAIRAHEDPEVDKKLLMLDPRLPEVKSGELEIPLEDLVRKMQEALKERRSILLGMGRGEDLSALLSENDRKMEKLTFLTSLGAKRKIESLIEEGMLALLEIENPYRLGDAARQGEEVIHILGRARKDAPLRILISKERLAQNVNSFVYSFFPTNALYFDVEGKRIPGPMASMKYSPKDLTSITGMKRPAN